MDAADDAAAGRGARHLLDLGLAIDREQGHAEPEGGGDLGLFLDGVAVGNAVGRGAGSEHVMGLGQRGDVEAAAEPGEELQDFRRRIGLHGVEHLGVRQRLGEVLVVLTDHVEVDDQARSVIGTILQEFADACGHATKLPIRPVAQPPKVNLLRRALIRTMRMRLRRRDCCLGPDEGNPVPHCWQRWTSPFGVPGIGAGSHPKKPFRRCFKPRRPWRAGIAGSPPAAGRWSKGAGANKALSPLGGCPASCPDAHRPTHGHRHVRNWAHPQ